MKFEERKCKVILLETEQITNIKRLHVDIYAFNTNLDKKTSDLDRFYNMYFINNDTIYKGDVVLDTSNNELFTTFDEDEIANLNLNPKYQKVIASTNKKIGNLNSISESFVFGFCENTFKVEIKEIICEIEYPKTLERQSGYIGWRCNCGKWHYEDEEFCSCKNFVYKKRNNDIFVKDVLCVNTKEKLYTYKEINRLLTKCINQYNLYKYPTYNISEEEIMLFVNKFQQNID